MEENIFRKTAETRTVIGSFLQSHEKEKNEFIDMIVVLRGYIDEFDKSWRKYVNAESKDDVRKSYVKVRGKEAKLNEFVGSVLDACTGNKRFYEKYWDDMCYVKKKICDILCELPRKPREVLEKTTFDFSIDLADENQKIKEIVKPSDNESKKDRKTILLKMASEFHSVIANFSSSYPNDNGSVIGYVNLMGKTMTTAERQLKRYAAIDDEDRKGKLKGTLEKHFLSMKQYLDMSFMISDYAKESEKYNDNLSYVKERLNGLIMLFNES